MEISAHEEKGSLGPPRRESPACGSGLEAMVVTVPVAPCTGIFLLGTGPHFFVFEDSVLSIASSRELRLSCPDSSQDNPCLPVCGSDSSKSYLSLPLQVLVIVNF